MISSAFSRGRPRRALRPSGRRIRDRRQPDSVENCEDEYGYSVFSSLGTVKSVSVTDVPPGSEVVLASDGYPELFGTLAESEARLNELIRLDPLCYKIYKSTKGLMDKCTHFDDRSYIRFRLE